MKNKGKIFCFFIIIGIISIFMIKNSGIDLGNEKHIVSGRENEIRKNESNSELKLNNENEDKIEVENINKKITIYISGAVNSPGVVDLNSDDRLIDGVDICGGVTNEADLNKINLAMKIVDEGHYIIPKIGEEIVVYNEVKGEKLQDLTNENIENKSDSNKININTATLSELDSLPGFGEVTAQKIIDYRTENTKFNDIEEIRNIKGIGDKKFNNVKDYICVQ